MTEKGAEKSNVDVKITVNLFELKSGERLRLKDGRIGEVVENIGDGQWVELSIDGEDPELIHGQDISGIVVAEG